MGNLLVIATNVVLLLAGAIAVGIAGMWLRRRLAPSVERTILDIVVLAVSALALAGVAAEIAAYTFFDVPIQVTHSQYEEYRPGRFAQRPNQQWVAQPHPGWHSWEVRTNEDGLRTDRPRPAVAVAADERRVLFFGDSYTFGIGLNGEETYPVQAEALLREQDPAHRWFAFNAGQPGTNVFSAVEWFAWIAERYRPHVVVFTVGEADDILPDLNTELRRRDRDPLRALNRLALYRMVRKSIAWLRYLAARARGERILAGELPVEREQQHAQLVESAALMAQTARRLGCAVVFNRLVLRRPTDETVVPIESRSLLRPYAAAGARFVVTIWDPDDRTITIPNDGHPSAAGALLLARAVVPAILEAAAQ